MFVIELISLFKCFSLLFLLAISKSNQLIIINMLTASILVVGNNGELIEIFLDPGLQLSLDFSNSLLAKFLSVDSHIVQVYFLTWLLSEKFSVLMFDKFGLSIDFFNEIHCWLRFDFQSSFFFSHTLWVLLVLVHFVERFLQVLSFYFSIREAIEILSISLYSSMVLKILIIWVQFFLNEFLFGCDLSCSFFLLSKSLIS